MMISKTSRVNFDEDLSIDKRNGDPVVVDDPGELLTDCDNLADHCADRLMDKQGQFGTYSRDIYSGNVLEIYSQSEFDC